MKLFPYLDRLATGTLAALFVAWWCFNPASAVIYGVEPLPTTALQATGPAPQSRESLIEPGQSVGLLKLGDTRERVLTLFPFKKANDAEYSYGSCAPRSEIHWLDMENGIHEVSFFLRDGRVFQIESATPRFSTREGFSLHTPPKRVKEQYGQLKAYVLLHSGGDEVGGRDLIYWVDRERGIAFEFHFFPKKRRRLLYKIIVFYPGTAFSPQGCVSSPQEWVELPPYSLEPKR